MISNKIDLTENQDFGNNLHNVVINGGMIKHIYNLYHNERIAMDEYIILKEYEKIFGKKFHNTQSENLFSYNCKILTHCPNCRRIMFPWERDFVLCRKCMELYGKIPWKQEKVSMFRNTKEIFSLK